MALSWKYLARREWARVKRERPDLVAGLVADNYSGGGGCLHPSGKLRLDLAPDDVAYESLARDCRAAMRR